MDRFGTSEQETLTCPLHLKSVERSQRVRLTSLTLATLQNAADLFIHNTVCHPAHYCRPCFILCSVRMYTCAAGGRQEVKRIVLQSENRWFDVEETLRTELLIVPDEQVSTLHGNICHQCMNVCVNGRILGLKNIEDPCISIYV